MRDGIGGWRIHDYAPGEGLASDAQHGRCEGWIAASAPGDTYAALVAGGRLADPFVARNEAAANWVRHREWWWHAALDIETGGLADVVELVFGGLDTFADVYCDGHLLGRADNMFRNWRFDLAGIAPGRHDLAVCFHPTAIMVAGAPLPVWSTFTDRISASRRTLMRKAQFGWGWDWGPDLPTVGIWQPVRIDRRAGAVVRSLNFSVLGLGDHSARVQVAIDLSAPASVELDLIDPDGAIVGSVSRHGSGTVEMTVTEPRLWWTAGLGEQPLYTVIARLPGSPDYRRSAGIRTIVIDQASDPDEPGSTFFRFVLNGVPIFAKGANWVPAGSCLGVVPDETYRDLLERAVAANMNMIRIWGGGIYETDIFYDECDRLGLLVWQDFMFACAPYPGEDPAFLANVTAEVTEQVARLRHHACLALWCGNNENQAIQFFEDHATGTVTPLAGQNIYDTLIPRVLDTLDPETPYWPTSPWGGPSPNSMRGGDVHNWTVWHGIPLVPDKDVVGGYDKTPEGIAFSRYAQDMARFVSEFGIQGAPDIGTLRRWMAPEDLVLGCPGFGERIKDEADKLTAMMLPFTGVPANLEQYVDFSMLVQAEGLAFGIEHYRRRMPHCSGALIWQHNDCWPCVSWSLIDYDGVAKASFYAVARAFAPVLASLRQVADRAELWVTNDRLEPVRDTATLTLARFAGGTDWTEAVAFDVPANASRCIWQGPVTEANDRILTVRSPAFPANRLLPKTVVDLALEDDPKLTMTCETVGSALEATITSACYAFCVGLRSDDPDLRFSDNHFDLSGAEQRVITITHRKGAAVKPDEIILSCWNRNRRL